MKSCYVLEFSVRAGSARHGEGHAYGDRADILERVPRVLGIGDDGVADPYPVSLVLYGATLGVWVVARGRFTAFVDLRPHVTLVLGGGRRALLDDAGALASLGEDFDRDPSQRARFELDGEGIEAALPELKGERIGPGDTVEGEFDPGIEPATGTYLVSGEFEYGSWDLETGEQLESND